ncbi:ATP-dependent DNA helicase PIF1-like [Lineus longissimus]|uniref:ATP-dependent DNA helicase PIF1-like n=1 Tax=Lineus longissimus TaxID=88925 RepID=UPI00315D4C0A
MSDSMSGFLHCSVTFEQLSQTGEVLKKTQHKSCSLQLGRNEFKEIILKLEFGKREMKFPLREIQVFSKFAKEGKATVKVINQKLQLMLANCPPDRLRVFLKTLSTKLDCLKMKGFVSDRKKLTSELPRVFQEISPLNMKDIETVHNQRAKQVENKPDLFTPKGKRKYCGSDDKENVLPKGKKLCTAISSLTKKPLVSLTRLTKEQIKVLERVKSGQNIFFTGSAGTGKSFLLKRIIGALPPQHSFATASTGVAACHIGGTTLHAFAGIGSGKATLAQCVELASRPAVVQQWKKCRHLIIDEISMVDGDFFDKLEAIARIVRKKDEPFGGIQLILCGDFLQLPPVIKGSEKRKFCFQSRAWRKCISINMELTDVKRQSDKSFISILQNIRVGRCTETISKILLATSRHTIDRDGIKATRLCTHKEDVNHINQINIDKLTTPSRKFNSSDSDAEYLKVIDNLSPVNACLELKEGAQVMLAKNLDVQKGLVNGARGVVVGFEMGDYGLPIVKFLCGAKETIKPERWTFKISGGIYLTRRQLPLKLAWAISIHKSQGMSLDCVEMSLSRVFESGQAYVALSRARSLEGLRVLDFDRKYVRAHPDVLRFYAEIQEDNSECVPRQTKLLDFA